MLTNATLGVNIPVVDLDRAKRFYTATLGLKHDASWKAPGMIKLDAAGGTPVCLYERPPSKADHTLASFIVDDITTAMQDLMGKGVKFEEYDMPQLKTVNGVATIGKDKAAWFKDSEGNILGLNQMG